MHNITKQLNELMKFHVFNLKRAVRNGEVTQVFDSECVTTDEIHSLSKDCVNLPFPTAIFRFKATFWRNVNLAFGGLFVLCFFTSQISADELTHLETRISKLETKMSVIKSQSVTGTTGAKMTSAAPSLNGYGLFVTADLLYWKLREGGTDRAIDNKSPPEILPIQGVAKKIDFDWDLGFRVGAGYHFEHDSWDALVNFTRFQTRASSSIAPNNNGSLIPQTPLTLTQMASEMSTEWKMSFYVLDVELGRNFFVSQFLALRPFLSLEGAFIFQNTSSSITVPNQNLRSHSKNHFMGVGPRAGIEGTWSLGPHWNLFGGLNGALLWGHFDVSEKGNTDLNANFHRVIPNVKMGLGIGWAMTLGEDLYRLNIRLSYESQYWWSQSQSLRYFNLGNIGRVSEDLTLDGVTLDVRLDF